MPVWEKERRALRAEGAAMVRHIMFSSTHRLIRLLFLQYDTAQRLAVPIFFAFPTTSQPKNGA